AAGRIVYRQLQGVPNARMPEAPAAADVVVDQVVLGNPATLLIETMAAGRLAVAHVAPEVRAGMAASDARGDEPPALEADAETSRDVVEQVLADRGAAAAVAARGPAWAARNHGGARSAKVLGETLLGDVDGRG